MLNLGTQSGNAIIKVAHRARTRQTLLLRRCFPCVAIAMPAIQTHDECDVRQARRQTCMQQNLLDLVNPPPLFISATPLSKPQRV